MLHSHIERLHGQGHTPTAFLINSTEAGNRGITDEHTTVFGLPIRIDDDLWIGFARLRLEDTSVYEFALPVRFTES